MILNRKTSTDATLRNVRVRDGQGCDRQRPVDLCGHHFRQHELAIGAAGFKVVKVVVAA